MARVGYEYGIRPFFILVGDPAFGNYFHEAKCSGFLYTFAEDDNGNRIPIEMAFLLQNEEAASKFLNELMRWVEKSNNDGDAVGLDFIEDSHAGYTVAIYPEIRRFEKRNLPSELEDRITPIIATCTQFYGATPLGDNFLNFKKHFDKSNGVAIGYVIGTPGRIVKKSEKYFIKKEFHFYHEDNIPATSPVVSFKAMKDKSKGKKFIRPPKPAHPRVSDEEFLTRRVEEIKVFFPITYNKLVNEGWLSDLREGLREQYDDSQVIQAICNLILFERIRKVNRVGINSNERGYPLSILQFLVSTYESFNSYFPPDSFFSKGRVVQQIKLDSKELKQFQSK